MNNPPTLFARRRIQQQSGTLHQQAAPYSPPLVVQQNQTLTASSAPYGSPTMSTKGFPMPWDWFGGSTPGGAPPNIDPSAHPGDIAAPVMIPTGGGTADFLESHTYAAGVQVSPFIPQAMIQSTIAQIPGFSDPQVFGIVNGQAGPFTLPPGVPSGANYVVSAKRTGPDVRGQAYPPNIIWIVDAGALPGGAPLAPIAPGPGGTAPSSTAKDDKLFGMERTTLMLLALAGIVGIVLVTSKAEKHTRPHATNPGRRRRIRR